VKAYLSKIGLLMPSQALKKFKEGVETRRAGPNELKGFKVKA